MILTKIYRKLCRRKQRLVAFSIAVVIEIGLVSAVCMILSKMGF